MSADKDVSQQINQSNNRENSGFIEQNAHHREGFRVAIDQGQRQHTGPGTQAQIKRSIDGTTGHSTSGPGFSQRPDHSSPVTRRGDKEVHVDYKERFTHAKNMAEEGAHLIRRVYGTLSSSAMSVARGEETGTVHQLDNLNEARRFAGNSVKAAMDAPRQAVNAVKTGANVLTATANVGRFWMGKETKALRTPTTMRSLNKPEKSLRAFLRSSPQMRADYGKIVRIRSVSKMDRIRHRTEKKVHKAQHAAAGGKRNYKKILKGKKQGTLLSRDQLLSTTDKTKLGILKARSDRTRALKKIRKAKAARKGLVGGAFRAASKATRESEDHNVQYASRLMQNRYARPVLKYAVKMPIKATLFVAKKTVVPVAKWGVKKIDSKLGVSKAVRSTGSKLLHSKPAMKIYHGVHGGVHKKNILMVKKTVNKIPLANKIGRGAQKLANSKAVKKATGAASKLKKAGKKTAGAIKKTTTTTKKITQAIGNVVNSVVNPIKWVALGLAAVVLLISVLGVAITASNNQDPELSEADGSELSVYVQALQNIHSEWESEINNVVYRNLFSYDNVYVFPPPVAETSTGAYFKEIVFLAYFGSPDVSLAHNTLSRIFHERYTYSVYESIYLACSGCQTSLGYCEDGCETTTTYCDGCVNVDSPEQSCIGHKTPFCPGHEISYCHGKHQDLYIQIHCKSLDQLYAAEHAYFTAHPEAFSELCANAQGWADTATAEQWRNWFFNTLLETEENAATASPLDNMKLFTDYRSQ